METQNKFTPQNLDYILSLDSDRWLFHADVLVDKAHVVMLEERDIISREQSRDILNGLIAIEQRGAEEFIEQELLAHEHDDVHTAIESVLIRELGEGTGGRMHTGRSRNDEVATCIRIALRDDLIGLMKDVNELRSAVIAKAAEHVDTVMPGYTHLPYTTSYFAFIFAFYALTEQGVRGDRANACPLFSSAKRKKIVFFPFSRYPVINNLICSYIKGTNLTAQYKTRIYTARTYL